MAALDAQKFIEESSWEQGFFKEDNKAFLSLAWKEKIIAVAELTKNDWLQILKNRKKKRNI
jgi:hypothetical protein